MAVVSLNLPKDIPWKLIAVSPDMMDTTSRNREFPFAWRSSLAISAYEPKLDELPEERCGDRLTYLKVSVTITGYQPTREETESIALAGETIHVAYPNVPTEEVSSLVNEYWGCYGVLLNVAVFPLHNKMTRKVTRVLDFRTQDMGAELANPYERGVFSVETLAYGLERAISQPRSSPEKNTVVALCQQADGGQLVGLAIHQSAMIRIPPSGRVVATVCVGGVDCDGGPTVPPALGGGESRPSLAAYSGDRREGLQSVGEEANQVYDLEVEGVDIDRVEIRAMGHAMSLLKVLIEFDGEVEVGLDDYPHIIEFEPKLRDLYQGATAVGEVLTGSSSAVNTDKTFAHTESTQMGLSLSNKSKAGSNGVGSESTAALTPSWGSTDQGIHTTTTDSARERRERNATSTQITQMYNILTGYHLGTNRAVFVLLPRPNTLQATEFRTIVQGLRIIEGVQEFFLVVTRPEGMDSMCVEAVLETGHFHEGAEPEAPTPEYEEFEEDFWVEKKGSNCVIGPCGEKPYDSIKHAPQGFVIDQRPGKGDPEHLGLTLVQDLSHEWTKEDKNREINYDITADHVRVHGWIKGEGGFGVGGNLKLRYKVHYRAEQPKPVSQAPSVKESFLITQRGLDVCFRSGPHCPQVLRVGEAVAPVETVPVTPVSSGGDAPVPENVYILPPQSVMRRSSIVSEQSIPINPAIYARDVEPQARLSALKDLLLRIQNVMTSSWRLPGRWRRGRVSFLETDYFKDRLRGLIPKEVRHKELGDIKTLPEDVVKALGATTTLEQALSLDLPQFAARTGLAVEEAGDLRLRMLGVELNRREREFGLGQKDGGRARRISASVG